MKDLAENKNTTTTPAAKKDEPEKMNLRSFITIKKYSASIFNRINLFVGSNEEQEKTLKEWEDIYSNTMNRITK